MRPTESPAWATQYVVEDKNSAQYPNKQPPVDDVRDVGILFKGYWGRAWLNWILDNLSTWVNHHEGCINPVGSIIGFDSTVTSGDTNNLPQDLKDSRDWQYIGDTTVGSITINHFKCTGIK